MSDLWLIRIHRLAMLAQPHYLKLGKDNFHDVLHGFMATELLDRIICN